MVLLLIIKVQSGIAPTDFVSKNSGVILQDF